MEIAGTAIGVLGLAGLYRTCIEVLDALSAASRFGVNRELLQTRIEVERVRLMIWGDSVGLTEVGLDPSKSEATEDDLAVIDEALQRMALRMAVAGLLACFVRAFEDVEVLQKRYGLVPQKHEETGVVRTDAAGTTVTETALLASERPAREILSATFRKTYATFQKRTLVAQRQSNPLRRARWAIVDEPKFRALISELKAINDSLTSLLPAVRNKARVKIRAEIMQSTDVGQLQNLVSTADDVEDLISETASLRLEMLSTRGDRVATRPGPQPRRVERVDAANLAASQTSQPTPVAQPSETQARRSSPPPLPPALPLVVSPPSMASSPSPGSSSKPTLDLYNDVGALVIHKVFSKLDSLSCYAWLSGTWEAPELSAIQPAFHPTFGINEPFRPKLVILAFCHGIYK